ncbi:murein hydrolase activator EnvC [Legionella sp. km772]|uniref:murein hydrolase activator EnvC family protein n=1 Tax=Legionella sp. km772 TaxID=2498111 RepID=UPI000F8DCBCC|nr:peptidase M24 [Legionella sp. km772]
MVNYQLLRVRLLALLVLTIIFLLPLNADSTGSSSVSQTQSKLKQINNKIELLKRTIASAHDRRGALNKELAGTEKQLGEGIRKLRLIQHNMDKTKQKIMALQNKINALNQQLAMQQHMLAGHVRARYQMGEYQPLKWLLDQETPHKINRLLTYYLYIIKSRQELIDQIDLTREKLTKNNEQLNNELALNQQLETQLLAHQQQFEKNKSYHTALIDSIDEEIESTQNTLLEFEKDKKNLSRLLVSLAQRSVIQNTVPFIKMRKKLPLPVLTQRKSLKKMNQGVTIFADEGTAVTAIYPGKVVFSDWLKGYGLLLIIDHGQGFMTLYAHNESLFKHKGQTVRQNEQIASVGHSGGIKQNGLYFEIRLRGKAISPLDWLA